MSKKPRDDEVTQQIRVGRELLDEAVRASEAAVKRIQSSAPPQVSAEEQTPEPEPEPQDADEEARDRETQP